MYLDHVIMHASVATLWHDLAGSRHRTCGVYKHNHYTNLLLCYLLSTTNERVLYIECECFVKPSIVI
jgi:hypothetical protein